MKIVLLGMLTCCFGFADTISISLSLDEPLQITSSGSFLDFSGTITNTGSDTVFLNGADVTLPYFELNYDLTPFFILSPASLSAGDSYSGDLFTVAVSGAALSGDYFGALSIQGGADASTFDDLAGQSFQIIVPQEPSVPEPATFGFLLSAFAGLGAVKGSQSLKERRTRSLRRGPDWQ